MAPEETGLDLTSTVLDLPGARNVRDLGGYAVNGGRLLPGRFLRAELLARPGARPPYPVWDGDGPERYLALGLRTVIDLRSDVEVSRTATAWRDATGAEIVQVPIAEGAEGSDTNMMAKILNREQTSFDASDLAHFYTTMLDRRGREFGDVFAMMADPDRYPVLVHCSAGKDRTGLVVALLLDLLGAARELIVTDYELTGVLRPDIVHEYADLLGRAGVEPEDVRIVFETPPEAMEAALDHLHDRWGGAHGYLVQECGLDDEQFAAIRSNLVAEA